MLIGDRITIAAPDVSRENIRFGLWSPEGTPSSSNPVALYELYVDLTKKYLEEISISYRRQFDASYRRAFTSANFEFVGEAGIGAFTESRTGPQNIFLRLGNLLAVEDASLA